MDPLDFAWNSWRELLRVETQFLASEFKTRLMHEWHLPAAWTTPYMSHTLYESHPICATLYQWTRLYKITMKLLNVHVWTPLHQSLLFFSKSSREFFFLLLIQLSHLFKFSFQQQTNAFRSGVTRLNSSIIQKRYKLKKNAISHDW